MDSVHLNQPIARWKLTAIMVLFFASWFAVRPIWHAFALEGPAQRAIPLAIPAVATVVFVRALLAIAPRNLALRRYGMGLLVCLLGYLALVIAANIVATTVQATTPLVLALQIVPIVPMLAFLWVIARYLKEEEDEYQRMLAVQSALVGSGLLLATAMIWEPLQRAGVVGPAHTGLGFVVWCAGFGIARMALHRA